MEISIKRVALISLALLLGATVVWAVAWNQLSREPVRNKAVTSNQLSKDSVQNQANQTGPRKGSNWAYRSQKETMKQFESSDGSASALAHKKFASIDEAIIDYSYAKAPKNSLGKAKVGIYELGSPVGIAIFYENGLMVEETKLDPGAALPNYQLMINDLKRGKEAGSLKSDSVPVLVNVNGVQGMGGEPGYNLIDGSKEPRPGFVAWVENRVEYTIYGENISLDQLLEVARSIK